MLPHRARSRALAAATSLALLPLIGVAGATAAVGAPAPASARAAVVDDPGSASWVTFAAENGSFVGSGASYFWSDAESSFSVGRASDRGIVLGVRTEGPSADFAFAAPEGQTLTEGTYTGAQGIGGDASRPRLDVADGGTCGEVDSGTFTVRDIAPDLGRLWIEYRFSCGGISGEIRISEPVDDGPVVAPTTVPWSDTTVGADGRIIPVTVVNNDPTPFTVDDVEVTSGAEEFSVESSTCDTVVAGDFCRVWVQMRPRLPGERTGSLTVRTDAGDRVVPLRGRGEAAGAAGAAASRSADRAATPPSGAPPTAGIRSAAPSPASLDWRMTSDQGSWVGQGRSYALTELDAFRGSDTSVTVDSGTWSAWIAAPLGQLILPGTVLRPAPIVDDRTAFNSGPRVAGEHRSCNHVTDGYARVHEARYDRVGRLEGLVATFSQTCDDDSGALRGVIAVDPRATVPPVPGTERPAVPAATSTTLTGPARPVRGQRAVLSGRVLTRAASAVTEGRVRLERWAPARREWRTATSTAMDVHGRYLVRVALPRTTRFRVRYLGTADHAASRSRVTTVRRAAGS